MFHIAQKYAYIRNKYTNTLVSYYTQYLGLTLFEYVIYWLCFRPFILMFLCNGVNEIYS